MRGQSVKRMRVASGLARRPHSILCIYFLERPREKCVHIFWAAGMCGFLSCRFYADFSPLKHKEAKADRELMNILYMCPSITFAFEELSFKYKQKLFALSPIFSFFSPFFPQFLHSCFKEIVNVYKGTNIKNIVCLI